MTKSPIIMAVATTLMLSSASFAATGDFGKIDANADGKITLEEGMILHPNWTAEAFKSLDTNADGSLNEMEYEAAATSAPAASDPAATTTDPAASTATSTDPAAPATTTDPAASTATSTDPAAPAATSNQAATTMRKDGPASYLDAAGPNDVLASNLIGMRIYAVESDIDDSQAYPADSRKDWADVGEVNDVVLAWDGSVKAVVLGVGGFLGIGEKDVAIEMSSLRKVRETNDSTDWFLVVNSSKDLLTSAPAYVRNPKS